MDPYMQGYILGSTVLALLYGVLGSLVVGGVALLVRRLVGSTVPVRTLLVRVWCSVTGIVAVLSLASVVVLL